jgi:hypothetical protein
VKSREETIELPMKGKKTSGKARGMLLIFTKQKEPDEKAQSFTVFEVELSALPKDTLIPDEPVNPEGKKLKDYITAHIREKEPKVGVGINPGGPFAVMFIKGTIKPEEMDPKDFIRAGDRSGFDFTRIRSTRYYLDKCFYEVKIKFPDRDLKDVVRDINVDNVSNDYHELDEDLFADHDNDKDNLFIYSVDPIFLSTRGQLSVLSPKVGEVVRVRSNFTEAVKYRGKKVSKDLKWTAAFSVKRTKKNGVELDKTFVKNGDNRITTGEEIELTEDLKKGDVSLPFRLESFDPPSVRLPKDEITLTIYGRFVPDAVPIVILEGMTKDAPHIKVTEAKLEDPERIVAKLNLKGIDKPALYRIKVGFKDQSCGAILTKPVRLLWGAQFMTTIKMKGLIAGRAYLRKDFKAIEIAGIPVDFTEEGLTTAFSGLKGQASMEVLKQGTTAKVEKIGDTELVDIDGISMAIQWFEVIKGGVLNLKITVIVDKEVVSGGFSIPLKEPIKK